jgi:hypothetical protein
MRALTLLLLLVAGPAFADSKAKPKAPPPKAEKAKPPACKKVGKRTVCTTEIEVKSGPSKPEVLIVPRDARSVTGRPKSEDRLKGLGPHTK